VQSRRLSNCTLAFFLLQELDLISCSKKKAKMQLDKRLNTLEKTCQTLHRPVPAQIIKQAIVCVAEGT